jgi:CheY-like chemotaxis protein
MPRVTVVNDDPDFLALMDEVLDMLGHDGTAVRAGDASLESIADTRPELLILDLHLAGDPLSGWVVAKAARRHPALVSVPIVIASGDHDFVREREEELKAMPDLHLLLKPFGIGDVEQLLRRLLSHPPT